MAGKKHTNSGLAQPAAKRAKAASASADPDSEDEDMRDATEAPGTPETQGTSDASLAEIKQLVHSGQQLAKDKTFKKVKSSPRRSGPAKKAQAELDKVSLAPIDAALSETVTIAVMGPQGAGKSTTVNIMIGAKLSESDGGTEAVTGPPLLVQHGDQAELWVVCATAPLRAVHDTQLESFQRHMVEQLAAPVEVALDDWPAGGEKTEDCAKRDAQVQRLMDADKKVEASADKKVEASADVDEDTEDEADGDVDDGDDDGTNSNSNDWDPCATKLFQVHLGAWDMKDGAAVVADKMRARMQEYKSAGHVMRFIASWPSETLRKLNARVLDLPGHRSATSVTDYSSSSSATSTSLQGRIQANIADHGVMLSLDFDPRGMMRLTDVAALSAHGWLHARDVMPVLGLVLNRDKIKRSVKALSNAAADVDDAARMIGCAQHMLKEAFDSPVALGAPPGDYEPPKKDGRHLPLPRSGAREDELIERVAVVLIEKLNVPNPDKATSEQVAQASAEMTQASAELATALKPLVTDARTRRARYVGLKLVDDALCHVTTMLRWLKSSVAWKPNNKDTRAARELLNRLAADFREETANGNKHVAKAAEIAALGPTRAGVQGKAAARNRSERMRRSLGAVVDALLARFDSGESDGEADYVDERALVCVREHLDDWRKELKQAAKRVADQDGVRELHADYGLPFEWNLPAGDDGEDGGAGLGLDKETLQAFKQLMATARADMITVLRHWDGSAEVDHKWRPLPPLLPLAGATLAFPTHPADTIAQLKRAKGQPGPIVMGPGNRFFLLDFPKRRPSKLPVVLDLCDADLPSGLGPHFSRRLALTLVSTPPEAAASSSSAAGADAAGLGAAGQLRVASSFATFEDARKLGMELCKGAMDCAAAPPHGVGKLVAPPLIPVFLFLDTGSGLGLDHQLHLASLARTAAFAREACAGREGVAGKLLVFVVREAPAPGAPACGPRAKRSKTGPVSLKAAKLERSARKEYEAAEAHWPEGTGQELADAVIDVTVAAPGVSGPLGIGRLRSAAQALAERMEFDFMFMLDDDLSIMEFKTNFRDFVSGTCSAGRALAAMQQVMYEEVHGAQRERRPARAEAFQSLVDGLPNAVLGGGSHGIKLRKQLRAPAWHENPGSVHRLLRNASNGQPVAGFAAALEVAAQEMQAAEDPEDRLAPAVKALVDKAEPQSAEQLLEALFGEERCAQVALMHDRESKVKLESYLRDKLIRAKIPTHRVSVTRDKCVLLNLRAVRGLRAVPDEHLFTRTQERAEEVRQMQRAYNRESGAPRRRTMVSLALDGTAHAEQLFVLQQLVHGKGGLEVLHFKCERKELPRTLFDDQI